MLFEGRDITTLDGKSMRRLRRDMQIVFQEPFDSLNPQLSVGRQIAEPLRIHTDMTAPSVPSGRASCCGLVGPAAERLRRGAGDALARRAAALLDRPRRAPPRPS